jgi:hypothetical protein
MIIMVIKIEMIHIRVRIMEEINIRDLIIKIIINSLIRIQNRLNLKITINKI